MSTTLNRFSNFMALAVPAAGLLTCGQTEAASDFYLKIDGIDGESESKEYHKHVEVLSWSWGATNPSATGGGGGTGKVSLQDFHFTTKINSSSPALFLACAKGTHIANATFRLTKPSATGQPVEYYTVTLSDVLISGISSERPTSQTGAASDGVPVEKVTLSFLKIQMDYRPISSSGQVGTPVTASIDFER